MYTFIPLYPTKCAWENKQMSNQPSLQALASEAKTKFKYTGGQILFHRPPKEGGPDYWEFSGGRGLEPYLIELKWDPTLIKQIFFYRVGYYWITEAPRS